MSKSNRNSKRIGKATLILAALLVATVDAFAQNRIQRQVLVSIPDRKLAVMENGEVLKVFPVAVGVSRTHGSPAIPESVPWKASLTNSLFADCRSRPAARERFTRERWL